MELTIRKDSKIIGYVVENNSYLDARSFAHRLAVEKNFIVLNMPQLIKALTIPEFRHQIRPKLADTISSEYRDRRGKRVYFVAHGMGPIASIDKLSQYYPSRNVQGLIHILEEDVKTVFDNAISIHDVRKGNVPKNQPYSIKIDLDKDKPVMTPIGSLFRPEFIIDDRVLAVCGSPENRESLAKIIFNDVEQGGDALTCILAHAPLGSVQNRYNESGLFRMFKAIYFSGQPSDVNGIVGSPLSLAKGDGGLCKYNYPQGRFILAAPEIFEQKYGI